MSWQEIWSVTCLGSKLAAHVSPDGVEVSIGITNTLARTGVANAISAEEARTLANALLVFADAADRKHLGEALASGDAPR